MKDREIIKNCDSPLLYCRGCCKSDTGNEIDLQVCLGRCGAYWHAMCLSKEVSRLEKRAINTSFLDGKFRKVALKQTLCPACAKTRKCDVCETLAQAHLIQCKTCSRVFHEKCLGQLYCDDQTDIWQCKTCRSAGASLKPDNPFAVPERYFKKSRQRRKSRQDSKNYPSTVELGKWKICTLYPSEHSQEFKTPKAYICEFCLTFRKSRETMAYHYYNCQPQWPPGDEIYRDNSLSLFEVDGEISKKYCTDLCLLAKFWLREKNLYLEVEAFFFYILTNRDEQGYHLIGYFSKEKRWYKNNLACILVLPPYQTQGYGRFLIEFSYLLSRIEGRAGRPERPLSELGQKAYSAYWKSCLLEYFFNHQSASAVTIQSISEETGIYDEDVVNTLISLNMMKPPESGDKGPIIVVDWCLVKSHMSTKKSGLKIVPENLLWKPHRISDEVTRAKCAENEEFEITFFTPRRASNTKENPQKCKAENGKKKRVRRRQ